VRYKGFLLFFVFFICLHAMAMSESTDNTTEKTPMYGFAPDQGRWRHYATDADNTIYFYDRKSVVKQLNKAKVWIKFGDPMNYENTGHFYKEATALKEIDCNSRFIRTLEWNYLSLKGEQKSYPSPTKWENIEPETQEDVLIEAVCISSGKRYRR
jgi:hypothetical protein